MDLVQFHTLRTAVQDNAPRGTTGDVTAVEGNLRSLLESSGLFEKVEVEQTDDPDRLVIAMCEFRPYLAEKAIAAQLEKIWADRVRYPFWEAHALRVDGEHVEFEAASRNSNAGHYVTVHLVAQRARIPAQRQPID
ncbi:MAG TPA: hypothetical protein VFJ19_02015 [Nocardioidaceae bacterium]|nr:hypothetical protein [Nocardioidaceae bacterium]